MIKIKPNNYFVIFLMFLALCSCSQDDGTDQLVEQASTDISNVARAESKFDIKESNDKKEAVISTKKNFYPAHDESKYYRDRYGRLNPIGFYGADGEVRYPDNPTPPDTEVYTIDELKLVNLIKSYRNSIGLRSISDLWHGVVRDEAKKHNLNMIATNVIGHNGFTSRVQEIEENYRKSSIAVKYVAEIIASGFSSPEGALNAWKLSPAHKKVLDNPAFTDFGLKITIDRVTKKEYYTVIFVHLVYYGQIPNFPPGGFEIWI